jgi:hypothetical protein
MIPDAYKIPGEVYDGKVWRGADPRPTEERPSKLSPEYALAGHLMTEPAEKLAADPTYKPEDVYNALGESAGVDPAMLEKLTQVFVLKQKAPTDWAQVAGSAITAIPKGVADFARGLVEVPVTAAKSIAAGADGDTKNQLQGAGELAAATENGTTGTVSLLHGLAVKAADKITGGPSTPAEWTQRFLERAAERKQVAETEAGRGEMAKAIGLDESHLAEVGAQVDPERVARMGMVLSPDNLLIAGKGLTVGRAAAEGALKEAGKETLLDAVKQGTGRAMAATGGAINKAAKSVGSLKSGTSGAVLSTLAHTGITPAAGAAGAVALVKGAQVAGKGLEYAGNLLSGEIKPGPVMRLVQSAGKSAAHGAVVATPFAAGADYEDEAGQMLGAGAGLAGAAGAVGHAGAEAAHAVATRAFQSAAHVEPIANVPKGSNPEWEAAHEAAMQKLREVDPATANVVDRLRTVLPAMAKDSSGNAATPELYVVDAPVYDQLFKGQAAGSQHGFYDPATKRLVVRLNGSDPTALYHEPGHLIFDLMPSEQRQEVFSTIEKAYGEKGLSDFAKIYSGYRNRDLPASQHHEIDISKPEDRDYLLNEIAAEHLSTILRGSSLDGTAPSVIRQLGEKATRMFELLGLYQPGVGRTPNGSTVTPLGVGVSPSVTESLAPFFREKMQGPEVAKALEGAPQPAAAAPQAAPTTATPVPPAELPTPAAPQRRENPPVGLASEPPDPALFGGFGERPFTPIALDEAASAATPSARPTVRAEEIPQEKPSNIRGVSDEQITKLSTARDDMHIAPAAEAVKKATPHEQQVFSDIVQALSGSTRGETPLLEVVHRSIKSEGNPNAREARRTEQEAGRAAEVSGSTGERAEATKRIVPTGFKVTQDGRAQLFGQSADKIVAAVNDGLVAQAAAKNIHDKVPYENLGGKLTATGADNFLRDLADYTANQANGYRGDGQRLTRPKNYEGTLPAENPNYKPTSIDEDRANFLNMVVAGGELIYPKTNRVQKDKLTGVAVKPRNIVARELAEANVRPALEPGKPGPKDQTYPDFGGTKIAEFNPLRQAFEKAGIDVRQNFIGAPETLNLSDIVSVKPLPGRGFQAPSIDLTRAGFMPKTDAEAIEAPAIKFASGRVLTGEDHVSILRDSHRNGVEDNSEHLQGFVTTKGRFVDRRTAMEIATRIGQLDISKMARPGAYNLDAWDFAGARRFMPNTETDAAFAARLKGYTDPAKEKARAIVEGLGAKVLEDRVVGSFETRKYPKDIDVALRVDSIDGLIGKEVPSALKNMVRGFPVDIFVTDGKRWASSTSTSLDTASFQEITPDKKLTKAFSQKQGGLKFMPAVKSLDEIHDLSTEEFATRKFEGGLTKQAIELGRHLSKSDLPVLESYRDEAAQKVGEFRAAKNFEGAFAESQRGQFFREAAEAIRANHGEEGLSIRPEDMTARAFMPDTKAIRREANEEVRDVAAKYMKSIGRTYEPDTNYAPVKVEFAKRIADYYDEAKSDPKSPEVKASYQALADETMAQYRVMQKAGVKIEPWEGKGEPYKNSAEMVRDVAENKHLWFFRTENGFGEGEVKDTSNPMLADSGVEINGHKLLVNDIFRAVHDYFGHVKEGNQFGPRGEFNAWRNHSEMFSDKAQGALAAETLAQNSWVNYGKHMRDEHGNVRSDVPLAERAFAEQKAVVIPKELVAEAKGETFARRGETVSVDEFKDEHQIARALTKPGWTVITATQEALGAGTDKVNVEANHALAKELRSAGYEFTAVHGKYKGVDQGVSYLVTGIEPEAALELGQRYRQESILTKDGLVYADGTHNPVDPAATFVGDLAKEQDFYSQIEGGPAFSLGIDFSTREPLSKDLRFMPDLGKDTGGYDPNGDPRRSWIAPDGKIYPLHRNSEHAAFAAQVYRDADNPVLEAFKQGNFRVTYSGDGGLFVSTEAKKALTEKQRQALIDLAIEKGLSEVVLDTGLRSRVIWTNEKSSAGDFQFMPARPDKRGEFVVKPLDKKRGLSGLDIRSKRQKQTLTPKTWILPDGEVAQANGFHENYLAENSSELNKRFGTKFGSKPDQAEREAALKRGFVRLAYENNSGTLNVEADQSRWNKAARDAVLGVVADNLGKIDNMRVSLLNDDAEVAKSDFARLFQYDDKEKLDHLPLLAPSINSAAGASDRLFQKALGESKDLRYMPSTEGLEDRISTRTPWAKNAEEDYRKTDLVVGLDAVKNDPKAMEKLADIVTKYPMMEGEKGTPNEVAEKFISKMGDNLLWLHDKFPTELRQRARLWYDGARRIIDNWSEKYGVSPKAVGGALAVLSPQRHWFHNVESARRVFEAPAKYRGLTADQKQIDWLKSKNEENKRLTAKSKAKSIANRREKGEKITKKAALLEIAEALAGQDKNSADLISEIEGKKWEQLTPMGKAVFMRSHEQVFGNPGVPIILPEGEILPDVMKNNDGSVAKIMWGSYKQIGHAFAAATDPSLNEISDLLGSEHKVRSFYNNMMYPGDTQFGDVTADTHAVAAGFLEPFAGSDRVVAQNFGAGFSSAATGVSGTYPLVAEAYRRAAKERNILPREMQSITWEAVRALFKDDWKTPKNKALVADLWKEYYAGKRTIDETRNAIFELAGGFNTPDWAGKRSSLGTDGAEGRENDAGKLPRAGLHGLNLRAASGRGGGDSGPLSQVVIQPRRRKTASATQ